MNTPSIQATALAERPAQAGSSRIAIAIAASALLAAFDAPGDGRRETCARGG